ncbi:MAG: SBBP repeat-containing protein [Anaerolineae bacterium]|nr:SBBP repeat-containing protein [Anaerolineae bacterium]
MRKQRQSVGAFALVSILILSGLISIAQGSVPAQGAAQPAEPPASNALIQQNYGQLPLSFVPNAGQTDEAVHFQVNSLGGTLFFTPQEVVLSLPQPRKETSTDTDFTVRALTAKAMPSIPMMPDRFEQPAQEPPLVVKMQLIGANAEAEIAGADPLPGIVNYFIGNDSSKWHTNIPTYAGVVYRNVYPGIDLQYDGHEGRLKGTYTVAAGIDPSVIRWRYAGAEGLSIDAQTGDLLIALANGNVLREVAPIAWQEKDGRRETVDTQYRLEDGKVSFRIIAYEASLPLVIDPSLMYSTYLGGSFAEAGLGIAVDVNGNTYVTGYTSSNDFPIFNAFQGTIGDTDQGGDAFVTKLNSEGNAVIYSTYIGGSRSDVAYGIAVDGSSNAYIAGFTNSSNYPTFNAYQGFRAGDYFNAFVTKLDDQGQALVYSTYLGGSKWDYVYAIAVDINNNAYVTGMTDSVDFPTQNAFELTLSPKYHAFVTKFNSVGNALVYSTYLGGNDSEAGRSITVDINGYAYVVGSTDSTNFPTQNPLQTSGDSFVTKLGKGGNTLVYSTYLGTVGTSMHVSDIAVDGNGNAYITGQTGNPDFPTHNPLPGQICTTSDVFVVKLNDTGSYIFSTCLGGQSNGEVANAIAVDSSGNIYITGATGSFDFPLRYPFQGNLNEWEDAFVTKLNTSGSEILFSSFLGGSGRPSPFYPTPSDSGFDIAVDGNGNVYVTGITTSPDFPILKPYQAMRGDAGWWDAFVSKINTTVEPQTDTIGIFRRANANFYLRNSNTSGFADSTLTFGASTDFPIAGDWNGDGIDTPGIYRQTTGEFYLTDNTANPATVTYSFVLGNPSDQPIVGDWDGDGRDGVGVFRPSNGLIYLKNALTTGFADFTMVLGSPGDVGIAGDWNGDGKDSPGVYRPSNQVFYLSNAICNCSVFADAELGLGIAGDTPFVGDWDGDSKSGVGVYRQSNGLTYIKNALTTGFADASFVFGSASDYPLAGYWVRVSPPAAEAAPTFQPAN